MKKNAALLLCFLLFPVGCNEREGEPALSRVAPSPPPVASTPKPEYTPLPGGGHSTQMVRNPLFDEMAKRLDTAGDTFFYADLRDFIPGAADSLAPLTEHPMAPPGLRRAIPTVVSLLESQGLIGLRDIGLSRARIGDLLRTKAWLRTPGAKRGELLNVLGAEPRACPTLAYAPTDSACFLAADLNAVRLLDLLRDSTEASGDTARIQSLATSLEAISQGTEADIEDIAEALGEHVAFVAGFDKTADATFKTTLGSTITISAPRCAILVECRALLPYNVVREHFRNRGFDLKNVNLEWGMKTEIELPERPGFQPRPAVAYDGKYLMVASHSAYVDALMATKSSESNLAGQEEFRRLSVGLPEEANAWAFISLRFGIQAHRFLDQALTAFPNETPADAANLLRLLLPPVAGMAAALANERDGLWFVSNRMALGTRD